MAEPIRLVVHATHEAGLKLGGIGAVLDGILGADVYASTVQRSVLVGPMLASDPIQMERLTHPRSKLEIAYSSLHGIFDRVTPDKRSLLQDIERTFGIALLYGHRIFGSHRHEVLLVDATNPIGSQVDSFQYFVWENYGIDSERYSWSTEYNLYFAIATPLFAALKALEIDADIPANQKVIIAHEWLGMPFVFAAQMAEPAQWRTVFYAHETATVRRLVEEHSGHDTRFYNVMEASQAAHHDLETIFGPQDDLFKHPILKQAIQCDNIFAVGDLVVQELRFLGGPFASANIDLVYNGVPATDIDINTKLASKRRLQQYCRNLLGYTPDHVFTHVTRMVISKALWRDIRVLEHLDAMLRSAGRTAVHFVLSTSLPAGRRPEWVAAWEQQYGWPVGHRGDNGDLLDQEVSFFFDGVEPFNQQARHCKIVLVNQFGWSQDRCGTRMPAEMQFHDIRAGSDIEFGQSIYEPFGIAQVEPLSFGALCCVSNVCGCIGFASRAAGGLGNLPNLVIADYVTLPEGYWLSSPYDALRIDQSVRDWIESNNSAQTAKTLFERLPTDAEQQRQLIERGQGIAQQMSWDVVVRDYLLPGLARALQP